MDLTMRNTLAAVALEALAFFQSEEGAVCKFPLNFDNPEKSFNCFHFAGPRRYH